MKTLKIPFTLLDWDTMQVESIRGKAALCHERRLDRDGLRIRLVEYEPGYIADHWCDRGHVFQVLSGEITIVLTDGRETQLTQGMGFCVSDFGDASHMVRTSTGCQAFIVD